MKRRAQGLGHDKCFADGSHCGGGDGDDGSHTERASLGPRTRQQWAQLRAIPLTSQPPGHGPSLPLRGLLRGLSHPATDVLRLLGVSWQDSVKAIITPSRPVQTDDHVADLPALQDCPDPQLPWLLVKGGGQVEGKEIIDHLGTWCLASTCIHPRARVRSRGGSPLTGHTGGEGEGRSWEAGQPLWLACLD